MPKFLEMSVQIMLMWGFISKYTLKRGDVFRSKAISSMYSCVNFVGMKYFLEKGWKIVYLVSSIFIENLFALNHVDTFLVLYSFTGIARLLYI